MEVSIGRNGSLLGAFSEEEVRTRVFSGDLQPGDLGWHPGLVEWAPLAELYPPTPLIAFFTPTSFGGFWRRAGAALLDLAFLYLPCRGVEIALDATAWQLGYQVLWTGLHYFLIGIIVSWLYHALMESTRPQGSVGKLLFRLKVTDLDGARITFARATGRHFGKQLSAFLLGIGFIMAGYTEMKQALHDMLAECLVLRRS